VSHLTFLRNGFAPKPAKLRETKIARRKIKTTGKMKPRMERMMTNVNTRQLDTYLVNGRVGTGTSTGWDIPTPVKHPQGGLRVTRLAAGS
jgi:hypothetical protein